MSATGPSALPFTVTGVPRSKPITTSSGVSGAWAGSAVSMNMSGFGAEFGSSRFPPSCERCQRFASRE